MKKEKEIKTNAMRILEREKIPFEVTTYVCDKFISGVAVADSLGESYDSNFKTIVLHCKSGGYAVCVVPVDKEIDLKKAAVALSEKSLEPIHVKEIETVTGYIRGGCTPIGMKKQFPTIIHESAIEFPKITISGGRIGSQIHLSPADLLKVCNAKLANIIL